MADDKKLDVPSFADSAKMAKHDHARLQQNPVETGFVAKGQGAAKAEPEPTAPPPNLFSGTTKKLEVFGKPGTDPNEPVPGHVLYWFDDVQDGLMISQAKASGYTFVTKDEVALNDAPTSPGNTDLGDKVRRWVGTGSDHAPVFSYLMKKTKELHELHMTGPESLEQRIHRPQEEALSLGTIGANAKDRPYTATNLYPGTRSNLPPISIGRYYKRPQT